MLRSHRYSISVPRRDDSREGFEGLENKLGRMWRANERAIFSFRKFDVPENFIRHRALRGFRPLPPRDGRHHIFLSPREI